MATNISGTPGFSTGRSITPINIHTNRQLARYVPAFNFLDGSASRDPGNTPTSCIRCGMILGKITASGLYAPSILGLTTAALGGGQTTLSTSAAVATEVSRRLGASGTLTLTGANVAGGTVRGRTITYSAVNTTTGAITLTADAAAAVSAVNQINSIPMVDSTGSGTFTITVEGITTAAITYSATAATDVTNINAALNAAFGTSAIVASGASLAALILTFSGTGYSGRPVGLVQATVLAGSTGYTINGSGTVGTPSTCAVTTAGVTAVAADEGEFVSASIIGPVDGSQTPFTIFDNEQGYATDVLDGNLAAINQPIHRYLVGADLVSANIINLTSASADAQAWLKTQLQTNGRQFTFDNNR